ncbi:MAG: hypothetical protein GY801_14050 [bacterium]|nr:hypothetical protein [bacterium]
MSNSTTVNLGMDSRRRENDMMLTGRSSIMSYRFSGSMGQGTQIRDSTMNRGAG